ncbi:MAG: sigma-54-dependent Fis family transcriptional regulator [Epsilonproteobacteria bacterium]|nr:sigma-54-dependent Fis family transcriptional regulator [Campylobacterota bacterium]
MKIAIVEDDINMRKSLELALQDDYDVVAFRSAVDALKKLDDSIDLIITDITMPRMDGIEFVKQLNGKYEVIMITGNATLNKALECLRLGVKDFLTKPFEMEDLIEAIERNKIIKQKKSHKKEIISKSFIANSPAILQALEMAKKVAKTDASVLLLGESGVGKEEFAKFIHDNSPRKDAAFVAINMSAIPENLVESELFGYEKGAFTDAINQKVGLFEAANKGTLFLDEIAEMPYHLQAKLLRVIQEKEMYRLGGTTPIKLDIRIISATNKNLHQFIQEGKFREDLYYRLNTVPIEIPPLRQRKEDIMPIADMILQKVIKEYDLAPKQFSPQAIEELLSYEWPGNVRELISVVERAAILSSDTIEPKDLCLIKH